MIKTNSDQTDDSTSDTEGLFATPGTIKLAGTSGIATESIRVVTEEVHCFRLHPGHELVVAVVETRERWAALLCRRGKDVR